VWRDRMSSRCRAVFRVRVTGSVSSAVRTKVKFGNLDWIGSHLVFGVSLTRSRERVYQA
jgi:hypothetical protein